MNERRSLRLIIGLYAIFGLGYSLLMPMWEAPDEPDHYLVVLSVARSGEFPPRSSSTEVYQPELYYWLASWPLVLLDQIDPSLVDFHAPRRGGIRSVPRFDWNSENHRSLWGPHLLRWINLALGGLTLVLLFRSVRRFAPHSPTLALATVSLAGLTPQFLHISASVSNDPLANLAGAYLFWLLSGVSSRPLRPRDVAFSLSAALVMPVLCKLTVLPMSLALSVAVVWRTRDLWRVHWRRMLTVAALLLASGALALMLFSPTTVANLSTQIGRRLFGIRPDTYDYYNKVLQYFSESYWGCVGWMSVSLPGKLPNVLTALAGMGGVASLRLLLARERVADPHPQTLTMLGFIILIMLGAAWVNSWPAFAWAVALIWLLHRSFRRSRPIALERKVDWAFLWMCIGFSAAAVLRNLLATPQAQGRFVFPALGAISLVVTSGWLVLLPPRAAPFLPHSIVAALAGINLTFWLVEIVPVYYQPFLDAQPS